MDRTKKPIEVRKLGADQHAETAAMMSELEGGAEGEWPLRFRSQGDTKDAGKRR